MHLLKSPVFALALMVPVLATATPLTPLPGIWRMQIALPNVSRMPPQAQAEINRAL